MQHLAVPLLACSLLFACGDDGDTGPNGATFGTCDLRSLQSSCIESTGATADIENQHSGCEQLGGAWSSDPCPTTAELLGCCSYTFGLSFRECFYMGTAKPDPEAYCASWDDGAWTPAP